MSPRLPVLAQSRHSAMSAVWSLSEDKRTWRERGPKSGFGRYPDIAGPILL
jgi:hypothetical protein